MTAALAGAALCLFAAHWLLPMFGFALSLAAPLPLALIYRRLGPGAGRKGLLLGLVGSLLLALWLTGDPMASVMFVIYAAMAAGLGEGFARGLADERSGAWAALAACAAAAAMVLAAAGLAGLSPAGWWHAQVSGVSGQVLAWLRASGAGAKELADARVGVAYMSGFLYRLGPGWLSALLLLVAWLNLLLTRTVQRRLKWNDQSLTPLVSWRSPGHLVWLLIAAGGMSILGSGTIFWVGANLLLPLAVIYFWQGLAVAYHWLEVKKAPLLLRAAIYLLIAFLFQAALAVALLGLLDTWFNFRRRGQGSPA